MYRLDDLFFRALRKVIRLFHKKIDYKHISIKDGDVSEYIYYKLMSPCPFMACRFGSTEFSALQQGYLRNENLVDRLGKYWSGFLDIYRSVDDADNHAMETLCFFSGFFPNNSKLLDGFYHLMKKDMAMVDLLGVWLKEDLFAEQLARAQFCNLGCLEPYDYDKPWTKALEGKRILVIHPFATTIERQYSRRELLWENKDILPEFDLLIIKAVQTIAGEKSDHKTWFEALLYMQREIEKVNFDVALIGCGAYGFPLAAFIKQIGKKAVHLGGATQILFGIKGKRWDDNPSVSRFYNEYWVYPSTEETPKNNKKVENGCYW